MGAIARYSMTRRAYIKNTPNILVYACINTKSCTVSHTCTGELWNEKWKGTRHKHNPPTQEQEKLNPLQPLCVSLWLFGVTLVVLCFFIVSVFFGVILQLSVSHYYHLGSFRFSLWLFGVTLVVLCLFVITLRFCCCLVLVFLSHRSGFVSLCRHLCFICGHFVSLCAHFCFASFLFPGASLTGRPCKHT